MFAIIASSFITNRCFPNKETPYLSLRKSTTPPIQYKTPKESSSAPSLLETTEDKLLVGEQATEQQTKGKEIEQEEGKDANQTQARKQTRGDAKAQDKEEEAKATQDEEKGAGEMYQFFSTPSSSTSSPSSSS